MQVVPGPAGGTMDVLLATAKKTVHINRRDIETVQLRRRHNTMRAGIVCMEHLASYPYKYEECTLIRVNNKPLRYAVFVVDVCLRDVVPEEEQD